MSKVGRGEGADDRGVGGDRKPEAMANNEEKGIDNKRPQPETETELGRESMYLKN